METLGVSCWDFAYPTGKCSLPSTKNCSFLKQAKSKHQEHFNPQTVLKGEQRQKTQKGSKHDHPELKTYLLSSPTPASVTYPHTYTTISTLLLTPNTKLIYLVPQSNIVCPKACELMRLPRAVGSSFQILPVPPEIEMRCGGQESCSIADVIGVEEVVGKVLKNTKVRSFDGYIAFEDEREAWTFLEHVGSGVKCAAKKS